MSTSEEKISVEEAQRRARAAVTRLGDEEIDLADAYGRVLAADVVSDMDVAPFDNTAMDGFAVIADDLADASPDHPVTLRVVAHEGAGDVFRGPLASGTTVRIMTGAPIPEGCDAVVKYEEVRGGLARGDDATFTAPAKPGANIRRAGEEFRAGDVVLRAGERVNPYAMGMLASAGATRVTVVRQPVVAVFAIGSELVDPGVRPTPGKIRNSNTMCVAGLVRDAGARVRVYPTVADDRDAIRAQVAQALADCDAVVTAGGASKGDFDFINGVIAELGTVVFDYVNMRPGKRQTMGVVDGKPVYGLSGNPAAAAVGFELLVRPALNVMAGVGEAGRPTVRARLSRDVRKKETRRFYERGLVARDERGEWVATPFRGQSSALLGALQRCNALIVIPEESLGMQAGDEVTCLRLDMPEGAQA